VTPVIVVVRSGLMTTVQDRGRFGLQHLGVPPAGPMDALSFRIANLAVGNDAGEAALEVTLKGPELRVERDATFAICGADLSPTLDGGAVPLGVPHTARAGAVLAFGERRWGARAYVAVRGGIDVPVVLGSRATSLQARLPGVTGRTLKAGDVLAIGDRVGLRGLPERFWPGTGPALAPVVVRFLRGPDDDRFEDAAIERFTASTYRIEPQSNRMGYRLDGPPIAIRNGGSFPSEGSPMGSIQVPPSGQPILLMADRQTTGGYPRIGTVITADLSIAGQLAPGDELRFESCAREVAIAALRAQEQRLGTGGAAL
jgi:antagonist of KipI